MIACIRLLAANSPPLGPLNTGIVPQSQTEQASRYPLWSTVSSNSLMSFLYGHDRYKGDDDNDGFYPSPCAQKIVLTSLLFAQNILMRAPE